MILATKIRWIRIKAKSDPNFIASSFITNYGVKSAGIFKF